MLETGQAVAVGAGQLAPALDLRLEPRQAREQQGGPGLVEAVVEAESGDVVGVRVTRVAAPAPRAHAVGAQAARERRDLFVVGGEQAALAAGEDLVREERERGGVAPGSELAARELGARRVRCVLDQRQAMRVAQRAQPVHRGRITGEVHRTDGLGGRTDAALDVVRVEPEVMGAGDVGEHGGAAALEDGARRGRERERRDDHLVAGADAGAEVGEVQRGGAADDTATACRTPRCWANAALEGGGAGAEGEPARLEHLHHRGDVLRLEAEVVERDLRRRSGTGHRRRPRSARPRAPR